MQQLVRVRSCNPDGTAQVLCIRESACSGDCHKCSGCGAAKETLVLTAKNPIGAKPGQLVTVEAASGPVLASAAVLYLLPLVLFFAGYLALLYFGLGPWGGGIGFVLGLLLVFIYERKVASKRKTEYTITGIVSKDR
jgi:sigma-E factor negative regulatory protein RseC